MASLANQTISSTYDGLIKTSSDNAVPVSGVQALEDGSGNALALSVGRSGNGVTVSGNLAVDTNTLYVDAASDWVGIGTTTRLDSATKFQITANSSGVTSFSGGADDVIIEHNTNVGLTLATPNNAIASIYFTDPDRVNSGFLEYSHINDNFRIQVNGGEAMRIDSSGNVGIGESDPNTNLHIKENIVSLIGLSTTTSNPPEGAFIELENSSGYTGSGVGITAVGLGTSGRYGAMTFVDDTSDGTGTGGHIEFHTSNGKTDPLVERMRIDSSGRVSINGLSNGADLTILEQGSSSALLQSTGGLFMQAGSATSLVFQTDGANERMRIDSSGRVGIGTQSPANALHIKNEGYQIKLEDGNTTNTGEILVSNNTLGFFSDRANAVASSDMIFSIDNDTKMRITSGGNVLFGTTTDPFVTNNGGSGFFVASNGRMIERIATTTTAAATLTNYINPNGIVGSISVTGSSTAYNTSSDYRLKENVVEMTGALDRVYALKPSRFNFIADPEKTVDGFLAHEVAEVVPEAVTGEKDAVDEEGNPIYQGIDQSKLTPLLTAALKEAHALIKSLEARIEILENK